jgi:hypothetical protein
MLDTMSGSDREELYGVENPSKVDAVVLPADGGRIALVIAQSCEWDGSDRLFSLLQQKIHNHVGFATYGQLAKAFPDVARLPLVHRPVVPHGA